MMLVKHRILLLRKLEGVKVQNDSKTQTLIALIIEEG